MMNNNSYMEDKVTIIADYVGRDFMKLARELRELQLTKSDVFLEVAKKVGLGERKAFALARIARIFDELNVPDLRLNKIGWAKLQRISSYLDEDNAETLLSLAEEQTDHELSLSLRGESPIAGAKVMVLYLPEDVHSSFRNLLIKFGAKPTSTGRLVGNDEALKRLAISLIDD